MKNNYELMSRLVIQTVNVFSEALIVFNQNWNERKFIRHFGHTYITSHNTTHTTIVFECHTNFSQTIYKTNILICALTAHNRYFLPFHRLSTMCSNNNKHKIKIQKQSLETHPWLIHAYDRLWLYVYSQ